MAVLGLRCCSRVSWIAAGGGRPLAVGVGLLPVGLLTVGLLPVGLFPVGLLPVGLLPVGLLTVGLLPVGLFPVGLLPVGLLTVGLPPMRLLPVRLLLLQSPWAQFFHGTRDRPGPGTELVSPVLQGRLLTIGLPVNPLQRRLLWCEGHQR